MLLIGLGNPGKRYAGSRHNAGFQVIDQVSRIISIPLRKSLIKPYSLGKGAVKGVPVTLVKPYTYMNKSGLIIPAILSRTKESVSNLIVICDNLDLPPGTCRLKKGGSSGGQKGLESIIQVLGTTQFVRLFIGIGRPEKPNDVIDHVLSTPAGEERELIEDSVLKAALALIKLLDNDITKVMNELNRK